MVVTFIKPKTKTNGKLQAAWFCNDTVCYNRNDEECHRFNHAKMMMIIIIIIIMMMMMMIIIIFTEDLTKLTLTEHLLRTARHK